MPVHMDRLRYYVTATDAKGRECYVKSVTETVTLTNSRREAYTFTYDQVSMLVTGLPRFYGSRFIRSEYAYAVPAK